RLVEYVAHDDIKNDQCREYDRNARNYAANNLIDAINKPYDHSSPSLAWSSSSFCSARTSALHERHGKSNLASDDGQAGFTQPGACFMASCRSRPIWRAPTRKPARPERVDARSALVHKLASRLAERPVYVFSRQRGDGRVIVPRACAFG